MGPYLQKLTVPYEYPVYFTTEVFSADNPDLVEAIARKEPSRRHRVLVVVERAVAEAWPDLVDAARRYVARHAERLELVADPWIVPGGEAAKNDPAVLAALQTRLHQLRLDRQAVVLLVGGGALLDVGGYAAATVHRGIRVVRVPTTVLAQADSGVGVKNGVNAFGMKNFFGAFAPPFAVLNDARFLRTLERRDTVAGMAEAVKVALIRDADLFRWLQARAGALAGGDPDALAELIRRSAQLHLDHIATSGDPFEMGSARPLDFGHWAAHKLESLTGNRLRHGEAVAIGIALDTVYSAGAGLLAPAAVEPVLALLETLGFRLWDDALALAAAPRARPAVLDGLAEFREHLGGELTVTLLAEIGRGVEVHEMREERVLAALADLRRRAGAA
ncbi:MAG: 3-dehydroquinate synthase [Candidatus Rokuibacteriota bacterium]